MKQVREIEIDRRERERRKIRGREVREDQRRRS